MIYNVILDKLSPYLKTKLIEKQKKNADPLKIYPYIDSFILKINNKYSKDELYSIDKKCTRKIFQGGGIHPDHYATLNYTSQSYQPSVNIDFANNIARPALNIMGGGDSFSKKICKHVKKYIKSKNKNIKQPIINTISYMIAARILYGLELSNSKNKLYVFKI